VKRTSVAAVALVVAVSGAAGYFVSTRFRAPPPAPSEQAQLKLAERVPDVRLADVDGVVRSLSDWSGRSLIVNFWATWCAPCRREIPLLGRLQERYGPEGFQVVGIAADYRDKVVEYARQARIAYPLLIGEQEALDAAAAFGVEVVGFPFTIFADRQGRIIACHVGELTEPVARVILDAVQNVNEGRQTPVQARSTIEAGLATLRKGGPRSG
jgi:thiol-disulfide isomerase/thioredoxin